MKGSGAMACLVYKFSEIVAVQRKEREKEVESSSSSSQKTPGKILKEDTGQVTRWKRDTCPERRIHTTWITPQHESPVYYRELRVKEVELEMVNKDIKYVESRCSFIYTPVCHLHADHRDPSPHHSSSPSPLPTVIPQPTVAVTVHKTDRLRPDLNVTHPLVRVCLVNSGNGELVKKPIPDRCVTSYYEKGVDHIQPVLTQPWKKRGYR